MNALAQHGCRTRRAGSCSATLSGRCGRAKDQIDLRAVGDEPLRGTALLALLQVLHREGLGHSLQRDRADWAAQRIKNLSLKKAVWNAISGSNDTTSLIEEFDYPRLGPGMMWEPSATALSRRAARCGCSSGSARSTATTGRSRAVEVDSRRRCADSVRRRSLHLVDADHDPGRRPWSRRRPRTSGAADGLRYRDFLTVALSSARRTCSRTTGSTSTRPEVKVGRIQNFGSWSPYLVKDGAHLPRPGVLRATRATSLWTMADDDLDRAGQAGARADSAWCEPREVEAGYVVRHAEGLPGLRRRTTRRTSRRFASWLGSTPRTCTRSAATACTGTTTRTTRC